MNTFSNEYTCKLCRYKTVRKDCYDSHIRSKRHKKMVNGYDNDLYKVDDKQLIDALRVKFSKHTCIQDKIRNTNILTLDERFARYIV